MKFELWKKLKFVEKNLKKGLKKTIWKFKKDPERYLRHRESSYLW